MKPYYFSVLIFILLSKFGYCQSGWGDWETLFEDKNIKVEINFFTSTNSCEDGGSEFKYKYRFNGIITNATKYLVWKMDYMNCNNELYYEQNCIAIGGMEAKSNLGGEKLEDMVFYDQLNAKFVCSYLVQPFYEVEISSMKSVSAGLMSLPFSINPEKIEGSTNIFLGDTTQLTVVGGALDDSANWIWYKGDCGLIYVGTGRTITVQPYEATKYFVRAEGKNNQTQCLEIQVDVDKRSTSAQSISGDTIVCKGGSTVLKVNGGTLGMGAEWVWYLNDCNGIKIGQGNTIVVSPDKSSTYFVRAEGDLNITQCTQFNVVVYEKSIEPTIIHTTDTNMICEGNNRKLEVLGGLLATDAVWKWYSGSCNGEYVGKGNQIVVTPRKSTTYFVRGEGYCNKTICLSINLNVSNISYAPISISGTGFIYRKTKGTITVVGGTLGSGAQWEWYKNSCNSDSRVGVGSSLQIKIRKPTTYFVKAKGTCNETTCAQATIIPMKAHFWSSTYSSTHKKFLHLGFGIGAEWMQYYGNAIVKSTINGSGSEFDTTEVPVFGIGLTAEIQFHPIIKENYSFGLFPNYSFGIAPRYIANKVEVESSDEYYFYQKLALEMELAFGLKPIKVLLKSTRTHLIDEYSNSYMSYTGLIDEYKFNRNINQEVLCAGFRFGRYSRKIVDKRGNIFDITYTIRSNRSTKIYVLDKKDYRNLTSWNAGLSMAYWRQSAFRIRCDVNFESTLKMFTFDVRHFKRAAYTISLIYNYNRYY